MQAVQSCSNPPSPLLVSREGRCSKDSEVEPPPAPAGPRRPPPHPHPTRASTPFPPPRQRRQDWQVPLVAALSPSRPSRPYRPGHRMSLLAPHKLVAVLMIGIVFARVTRGRHVSVDANPAALEQWQGSCVAASAPRRQLEMVHTPLAGEPLVPCRRFWLRPSAGIIVHAGT